MGRWDQPGTRAGGHATASASDTEIERLSEKLEERERGGPPWTSRPGQEHQEVVLLRRQVAEKERARAASDVLCRSLADETHQLRRTLAATAHMCQRLAQCLDARQGAGAGQSLEPGCAGRDTAVQAAMERLQEENRLLKQRVTHVEDLNAQWQRYDASREEYVRALRAQLREPPAPDPEPGLLRKEICRLNKQLEARIGECAGAAQELAAARERAQMLEQQILVYKDDFLSERADRERAQGRIQELEDQVAALQRQASPGQDPQKPGSCRIHTGSRPLKPSETDGTELLAPAGQRPGGGSPCPAAPREGVRPGAAQSGQGELQCPHCLRGFGDEQGEELLRHVAECCL